VAAGTYHQTGQFDDAFPAGGGAGDGAQPAGVAQQISPPDAAARTKNRRDRHGAQASGSSVLEDAPGTGLSQWNKFGSHAGQPGNRHGVQ
jgi:hypothetical protein